MGMIINPHWFGSGGGPAAHRYWRLYITSIENPSNSIVTISEIEMREAIGGSDITGSGTASASGSQGGSTAADAFDNSTATSWLSDGILPAWIKYDFGAGNGKNLLEIALTARSANPIESPRDWSLQWSDDDAAWTTLWTIHGESGFTASEQRIYSDPLPSALYDYSGVTDAYDILGSALKGWYASDLVTGSNGDPIITVQDISGGGNYARQVVSALRPTLVTADLNSLNTLRYTSADLEYYNIPDILNGAAAASAYLVIKLNADPPGAGADSGLWKFGAALDADHFPYTDGSIYDGFASTVRKTLGNPTPALTSWRIVGFHSASADYDIYIDGVSAFPTGTNTVGLNTSPYFGRSSGGVYLNGWVAEMIFTNAKQSASDREKIEGYLAHKWALTGNLDAGHPYKSTPP